jgi:hypothetical protein
MRQALFRGSEGLVSTASSSTNALKLFIRVHNEAVSVVAMRVSNQDRQSLTIDG